ncbi:MAG: hypothetical protein WCO42_01435 [bacterium]
MNVTNRSRKRLTGLRSAIESVGGTVPPASSTGGWPIRMSPAAGWC